MGREIGVKQSRKTDLRTGGELGQLEGAGPPIPRAQERDEGRRGWSGGLGTVAKKKRVLLLRNGM